MAFQTLTLAGKWFISSLSASFGQSRFDTLTNALQQVFQADSLPGMSVVLVNQRKIIYAHDFGYADLERRVKYSSKSIQNVGSVSKTFAAIALMKAVELGYFSLETDINTILPFKVVNPNSPNSTITVRHLANHTSGIVDNPALFGYQGDEKLLKTSSYKAMFSPQFTSERPPKGIRLTTRNKSIFWNLYVNGGIGHDGDDPGVSCFLFFNPKTGLGGYF